MPRDDASELDWLLFRQDGVISRRQALAVMRPADLRRLVATGRWTRRHYGIYVAHNSALSPGAASLDRSPGQWWPVGRVVGAQRARTAWL